MLPHLPIPQVLELPAFSAHYALFLTQGKAVGDHGDEFAVCRLAFDVRHGVAEEFLQNLDIAAIPRDLDGMAYCTLDARRRCAEFFSDLGIQHLGDGIDYIHVVLLMCDKEVIEV